MDCRVKPDNDAECEASASNNLDNPHLSGGKREAMCGWKKLERAKGIEPSYAAWEAAVLPLNYARSGRECSDPDYPCHRPRRRTNQYSQAPNAATQGSVYWMPACAGMTSLMR